MNKVQENKSFLLPIVIFPIAFVLLSITILTIYNINSLNNHAQKKIQKKKKEFISTQKNNIYKKVHFANDSIKFQIKQMKSNINITRKKMQAKVLSRFKAFKKNDGNYLFIYELNNINGGADFATMILNENRPDLIGKKISDDYKDAKGKKFRKEFLNKIKKDGEGFVKYWYKKPNKKDIHPKLSYFYLQKDWNWIIASGFYFDDLTNDIETIKTDIQSDIDNTIKSSIVVAIVLSFITSIISYLISNRLNTLINNYIDQISSSEHKLKKAQNIAKIGSWKHTIKGNILVWSDEVYNIFEVSRDDKITTYRKFLSIIHPDDKANVSIQYNKSIQNQTPYNLEHRLLMNDGRVKYVREKCDIICNEQNQPIYTLGTVQDITNEVVKQKELDQKEQLLFEQSKMASMGEMIGNIAHQWRQPLSVISTAASGIQVKIEYDIFNKEEALKDLAKLEQSCQYLSHTIDDFQNFLKPAKNNELFNIRDIINKQMDMFGSSFTTSNIEFILNIEDVNINGNKNELLQVVINILNNAKDVLEEKKMDNKYIFIDLKKQNNNAILTIKDNADGIPDNILPKIFDAYFTTKHKNQGTGLGLYMSYQIIKNKFKGEITVSNNKYKYMNKQYTGAQFVINLSAPKVIT